MTETINQFGKNIALNCGFDLGAKSLLDSRSIVKDAAELDAIPDIRRANGLLVWVQDEKKLVAWDEPGQAWVEVSGGKFDSTEIEEKIEELESKVSADIDTDDYFLDDKDYKLTTTHGGLTAGTNIRGWKFKDILQRILLPPKLPTMSLVTNLSKSDSASSDHLLFKIGTHDLTSLTAKVSASDFSCDDVEYTYEECDGQTTDQTQHGIAVDQVNVTVTIESDYQNFDTFSNPNLGIPLTYTKERCWILRAKSKISKVADSTSPLYPFSGRVLTASVELEYTLPVLVGLIGDAQYLDVVCGDSAPEYFTIDYYHNFEQSDAQAEVSFSKELLLGYHNDQRMQDTFKVSLPAFSSQYMFIISPNKVQQVLNPSGFDITNSFRCQKTKLSSTLPSSLETIPALKNKKLYIYTSNLNSQASPYPLTITFGLP